MKLAPISTYRRHHASELVSPPLGSTPPAMRSAPPSDPIRDPRPHTHAWVAQHLGLAADSLAVATTRWNKVPYVVTGGYLQRSRQELIALIPDVNRFLPGNGTIDDDLEMVSTGIGQLADEWYLRDRLPPMSLSPGWLLAHYTHLVRRAQGVFAGIGPGARM